MKKYHFIIALVCILFTQIILAQTAWQPATGPLTTPWTNKVSPDNVLPEYPRPQMVREQWKNLNGLWDYTIVPNAEKQPQQWAEKILVPYPVESMLSGVKKTVGPDSTLWYRRTFTVPAAWKNQKLLLHFEAVDWQTTVWVNGIKIGSHEGGYDDFTFDISAALKGSGEQEIVVAVWDPSDAGYQPAGKQWNHPRSIWYTPTTGIWQTVWLEPVPVDYIEDFKLTPDVQAQSLKLVVPQDRMAASYSIKAIAYDGKTPVATTSGKPNEALQLQLKDPKLWSPTNPFLYDVTIELYRNGKKIDAVKSYFAMREIKLGKDAAGVNRLMLNGQPLFQYGPLDQGFWPDGLYTAPTDEALKYDIEIEKEVGFNMIRKHVKVEPKRWYYWCDKMGMLVWQDMPSGDRHIKKDEVDITRVAQSAHQYKVELTEMINEHYNSPCIVTWVPFNEGWGQFQTDTIVSLVRSLDSTRLISATSGWADRKVGDMSDIHVYPGPDMPALEDNRAAVLGEFGGQALVIREHLWQADLTRAPGHIRTSQTAEDLQKVYSGLIEKLIGLKQKGLAAAVYTQTTDVETEVNGIMTYDRKLFKMDKVKLKQLHDELMK